MRRAITVLLMGPKDSGIIALSSSENSGESVHKHMHRLALVARDLDEVSDQNLDL